MVEPGVAAGHDEVVDVAVKRDEAGATAGCRLGQLVDHRRVGSELSDQRQEWRGPCQLGAVMGCTERQQSVYVPVACQALHVKASDQPTETMADHVDTLVAGCCGELLYGLAQPYGCTWDVVGKQSVVISGQRLEAAPSERTFHHGEDRVVVDDPVHQQDRRLGRVHVVMDESTLFRGEAADLSVAAPIGGASRRRQQSQRIHHQVCCGPGCLDRKSRCHARQIQCYEAWEPRRRNAPIGTGSHNGILPSSRFSGVESDVQSSPPPLRIVVAKPGLDGHDRGAKVVARALRDAGMEVIYTGLHQTPEQIVATALAEDADAIGLSVLSGAHMTLFAKVIELLKAANAGDIVVFGGGIIPAADREPLAEMGVAQVFTPGATMSEIVAWVRANVGTARHI